MLALVKTIFFASTIPEIFSQVWCEQFYMNICRGAWGCELPCPAASRWKEPTQFSERQVSRCRVKRGSFLVFSANFTFSIFAVWPWATASVQQPLLDLKKVEYSSHSGDLPLWKAGKRTGSIWNGIAEHTFILEIIINDEIYEKLRMAEGKRDFRYLSLDLSRSSPGCSCSSRSGAPLVFPIRAT